MINTPIDNDHIKKQRPDIAKLSPHKLSYIANKGLVKRAQKAIEQGDTPTFEIADDLTLSATFADSSMVRWALDHGIDASVCSCPAGLTVLCRHQIQTALAYRSYYCQQFNPEALQDKPAHTLTAQQVSAAANHKNSKQALNLLSKSGMDVVLSFTENDPCAMARLSMATVHFWGGSALHECTCDCKKKLGCEHIILAAVAFAKQAASVTTPITMALSKKELTDCLNGIDLNNTKAGNGEHNSTVTDDDTMSLTDAAGSSVAKTSATTKSAALQKPPFKFTADALLQACSQSPEDVTSPDFMPNMLAHTLALLTDNEKLLFTQFYRYGISSSTDATVTLIDDIYQDNQQRHYLWLNDTLVDLKDWLAAYHTRRSDFDISQGNQLISAYLLRRLAGRQPALASVSLGIGIKAQTDMRPTQLMSLGCHISVHDDHCQAHTLLLDNKTHTPLLLQSTWQWSPADAHTSSHLNPILNPALSPVMQQYQETRQQRISAGITLAELQHGQLSTQRGRRSANHSITLNKSRRAYNQLLPYCISAETLAALPVPLRFQNTQKLRQHYKTRPLSFARPRYQQPNFIILPIDELLFIGYDAAQQTVGALIQTSSAADDTPYWIKLGYRSHTPFALPLLADTFDSMRKSNNADTDSNDAPHHVSGTLSWERFGERLIPVITPWAIFCDDRRVMLALDLPKHSDPQDNEASSNNSQTTSPQQSSAATNWQENPALSRLPLIDLSQSHKGDDPIQHVLSDCQSWLDEALIYGEQRLPNSFWQTQRQLIARAQQAGLKQLANSLQRIDDSTATVSMAEPLLMLVIQLAVMDEVTTVASYE